jgi:hypothetical protein
MERRKVRLGIRERRRWVAAARAAAAPAAVAHGRVSAAAAAAATAAVLAAACQELDEGEGVEPKLKGRGAAVGRQRSAVLLRPLQDGLQVAGAQLREDRRCLCVCV